MAEARQWRTGDKVESEIGARIRVQQRADVDKATSGGGKARIQRVRRGFRRPFGEGAAEFRGVFVGDQCVEASVERRYYSVATNTAGAAVAEGGGGEEVMEISFM